MASLLMFVRSLSIPCLLACLVLTTGCGEGDGGGAVTPVDSAVAIDASIDAPDPNACGSQEMLCNDTCINTYDDELNCGGCGTICSGGKACIESGCACPAGFISAEPVLLMPTLTKQLGLQLGIGGMFGSAINALVVGFPEVMSATIEEGRAYPLNGMITGPFAGAGYDVNVPSFIPSAAFAATAGTVTFTRICRDATMAIVGFSGALNGEGVNGATFSSVEGLFNPMLINGGCNFRAPTSGGASVAFDFNCPPD